MSRKAVPVTPFGKYLESKNVPRQEVAKALDVTTSYVSMLCRGPTTPGLKLALLIQKWTTEKFGDGFDVGLWV